MPRARFKSRLLGFLSAGEFERSLRRGVQPFSRVETLSPTASSLLWAPLLLTRGAYRGLLSTTTSSSTDFGGMEIMSCSLPPGPSPRLTSLAGT